MTKLKQKILFIDDDLTLHFLIRTYLENAGYECFCARNGSEGLDRIIQLEPDLILLDYMMPDLDGWQVYEQLISNPTYKDYNNIPVIILTAKESDSFIKTKFLESGISSYLQKPFGLPELLNVIENTFIINEIRVKNLYLQNEIQQTTDYLELLFNTIPLGIVSTDQYGNIKKVNSYFIKIMEIDRPETIIDKNLLEFDLFQNSELIDNFKKILINGITLTITSLNYITQNYNRISLKLKGVPLYNENSISGIIITVQDRTETERKQYELTMLGQISQFMHSTLHLDQLLHLILTAITTGCALGFSRAMIFLINQKTNMLEGRMGVGPANQQEANRIWSELAKEDISLTGFLEKYGLKFSLDDDHFNKQVCQIKIPLNQKDCFLNRIIDEKCPIKANLQSFKELACATFLKNLQLEEFLAVPLIATDKVIGIVIADNHFSSRPIDENMIDLLMIFATQAGLAIERAESYEKLKAEKNKLEKAYVELKNTQERLIHSERLATVGKMATQIAHEVRNPLVAIGGFARNILKLIEFDPTNENLKSYTDIIVNEVNRLENILSNILDFTRLSHTKVRLEDVNKIIEDVCVFINIHEEISAKGISIAKNLDLSLPPTLLDPQQIKQVLVNICQNALHSMFNGGELYVASKRKSNDLIEIKIRDTGEGMPSHVLEEMFNPFFTTKKNGLGLGLPISQQIIHSHGGKIDVTSEVGKGTTFTITLKITDDINKICQDKKAHQFEQIS